MSIELDGLYRASYKQVSFLADVSNIRGGRNDVLHKYANTGHQSIEDMGALPRSYTITAVITGTDYFQKRNQLLSVIEEGGAGILVHPFYGEIQNVVARNFTLTEDLKSVGAATITINFDIDNSTSTPIAVANTITEINSARDIALDSIANDLGSEWDVSVALSNSYEYAVEKLGEFSSAYETAMEPIRSITENVNNITSLVSSFNSEILSLTIAPTDLADSIKNLFSTANAISQSAEAAVDSFKVLFGFGSDSSAEILPDVGFVKTAANIQKTKNSRALSACINQMALAQAYVNYCQVEYPTVQDVDVVIDLLKSQSDLEQNKSSSSQTEYNMKDLQVKAFAYLDEVRKSAKSIVEIEQSSITTTRLLAYRAYGNSDLFNDLNKTNDIKDVSFISGQLKVLSE
jgi:prophage DNA circulation protein